MNTDIITNDLVIIEGHDVTDLVDVIDGHIKCTVCRKIVDNTDDITYYGDEGIYGENVGHDDCMTDLWLST